MSILSARCRLAPPQTLDPAPTRRPYRILPLQDPAPIGSCPYKTLCSARAARYEGIRREEWYISGREKAKSSIVALRKACALATRCCSNTVPPAAATVARRRAAVLRRLTGARQDLVFDNYVEHVAQA